MVEARLLHPAGDGLVVTERPFVERRHGRRCPQVDQHVDPCAAHDPRELDVPPGQPHELGAGERGRRRVVVDRDHGLDVVPPLEFGDHQAAES